MTVNANKLLVEKSLLVDPINDTTKYAAETAIAKMDPKRGRKIVKNNNIEIRHEYAMAPQYS